MTQYSRLTFAERKQIYQLNKSGKGVRYIARYLGRSPSTISEELQKKCNTTSMYNPCWAHQWAGKLKERNRRKAKIQGPLEGIILAHLLDCHCSPEQISGRLKRLFPKWDYLHVSPETIYRYVYRSSIRKHLIASLRRKHKRRGQKKTGMKRGGIKNCVSIHERPVHVFNREEFGHWEGDLIIGKGQKSAMGTLVERSSRFLMLISLKSRDSETVTEAFIEAFSTLPPHLRKSLTYDRGSEMAEHFRITTKAGMDIYFADAGQPQQRGTNENTNGLIREYFPKGIDLSQFTEEDVMQVQEYINQRPKKVLDYATPKEAMHWSKERPGAKLSCFQ